MAFEIILKNETESNKRSPISGSGSAARSTPGGSSGEWMTGRQATAKGLVAVNHYIKPFVEQMVTQHVTTVALRTGAQEAEERLSFKMQVGQKVYGLASSIITGALVGGVAGAVVGGAMSLVTTVIGYTNQQEKLNLQRSVENVGLRYMNARAGGSVASFSGSRLKNQ